MKILTPLTMSLLFLVSCQEGATEKSANGIPKSNPYASNASNPITSTDASQTNNTTDAPIDGGLSILLVAGAAYGTRRALKKKANAQ
ncbi:MAG TPA: hypothetical protein VMR70_11825 [Flavisolibacter sp.]|nr:hypothetical protein [Flavisolibacter sp.]